MDYQKMSDQTLDEIMQQIRTANNMPDQVKPPNQEVHSSPVASMNNAVDGSDSYLQIIESSLSNATIGKQIGLHKSPMHNKRGLVRKLARVVERLYLRIAELTNRDIREFNGSILAALHQFKSQIAQLLGNDRALETQLGQVQVELAEIRDNLTSVQMELANTKGSLADTQESLVDTQGSLVDTRESLIIGQEELVELKTKVQALETATAQRLDVALKNYEQTREVLNDQTEQLKFAVREVSESSVRWQESLKTEVVQNIEDRSSVLVEKHNQNLLEIRTLTEQLAGVKAIVKWTNNQQFTEAVAAKSIYSTLDNPAFYHEFEEKFRGTQEDIRQRLHIYLPVLSSHFETWNDKKFLDIGCGRGEWLDILKENGVANYTGLDLNDIQLDICHAKGHPVVKADCLQYIQQLPTESLDVITGMQIIEHLPLDVLLALLVECKRVLRSNGIVLFETPNNSNLITAATWFYVDPTHTKPIHKEVARFFVEHSGFKDVQVIETNPAIYSPALVKPTCFDGNQTVWNENVNLLNSLLYGAQDYAVLGVKL